MIISAYTLHTCTVHVMNVFHLYTRTHKHDHLLLACTSNLFMADSLCGLVVSYCLILYMYVYTTVHVHETIKEPQLPKTQTWPRCYLTSHPVRRTRFGQYQASSAALGWLGKCGRYMTCTCNTDGWPHDERRSMVAWWKSARPCCTLTVVLRFAIARQ